MSTIRLARSVDCALDFYGASLEALDDPGLCQHLWDDVVAAGFTLVMPPQFHRFEGGGRYEIIQGLEIDDFSKSKMAATLKEIEEERDAVKNMLG
jgi:hypothetical protein